MPDRVRPSNTVELPFDVLLQVLRCFTTVELFRDMRWAAALWGDAVAALLSALDNVVSAEARPVPGWRWWTVVAMWAERHEHNELLAAASATAIRLRRHAASPKRSDWDMGPVFGQIAWFVRPPLETGPPLSWRQVSHVPRRIGSAAHVNVRVRLGNGPFVPVPTQHFVDNPDRLRGASSDKVGGFFPPIIAGECCVSASWLWIAVPHGAWLEAEARWDEDTGTACRAVPCSTSQRLVVNWAHTRPGIGGATGRCAAGPRFGDRNRISRFFCANAGDSARCRGVWGFTRHRWDQWQRAVCAATCRDLPEHAAPVEPGPVAKVGACQDPSKHAAPVEPGPRGRGRCVPRSAKFHPVPFGRGRCADQTRHRELTRPYCRGHDKASVGGPGLSLETFSRTSWETAQPESSVFSTVSLAMAVKIRDPPRQGATRTRWAFPELRKPPCPAKINGRETSGQSRRLRVCRPVRTRHLAMFVARMGGAARLPSVGGLSRALVDPGATDRSGLAPVRSQSIGPRLDRGGAAASGDLPQHAARDRVVGGYRILMRVDPCRGQLGRAPLPLMSSGMVAPARARCVVFWRQGRGAGSHPCSLPRGWWRRALRHGQPGAHAKADPCSSRYTVP